MSKRSARNEALHRCQPLSSWQTGEKSALFLYLPITLSIPHYIPINLPLKPHLTNQDLYHGMKGLSPDQRVPWLRIMLALIGSGA